MQGNLRLSKDLNNTHKVKTEKSHSVKKCDERIENIFFFLQILLYVHQYQLALNTCIITMWTTLSMYFYYISAEGKESLKLENRH